MGVRTAISAAMGLAAGGAMAPFVAWEAAALVGWDAAAMCFLVWTWARIAVLDPGDTKSHANREDGSRWLTETVVLMSGVALLAAVGLLLVRASQSHGGTKAYLVTIGILSVVLCWGTVHTVFTLRYARCYFSAPDGSVDFNEDGPPDYRDFAYVAFTVGMTFQVSDTNLTTKSMRRTVLGHGLLSFLYGAVILALTINVVASLLG